MNETLYRAVDGMLSEAEAAELAARLGEDADLAREMLEIARDEALLCEVVSRRPARLPRRSGGLGWFLAGAAAVFLGIVGAILFRGGSDLRYDRSRVQELSSEAARAVDRDEFDRGLELYRQALAIAERHDELDSSAASLRTTIQEVSRLKQEHVAAEEAWNRLLEEHRLGAYSESKDSIKGLRDRARAFRDHPGAEDLIAKLDHEYDTALELEKSSGFQATRVRIAKDFLASEDFAGALAAWKAYLEASKNESARKKVSNELTYVHRCAFEAWDRLKKKADRLPREEGVKLLEEALPRFQNTNVEPEIRAKIEEWKK